MGIVVFFSHCMDDTDGFFILEIAHLLKKEEFITDVIYCEKDCWNNIVQFMDESLGKSDILVLFCSPKALVSDWVKKEWASAMMKKIPIIPIFSEISHVPPLLVAEKGVKFRKSANEAIVKELYELIIKKMEPLYSVDIKKEAGNTASKKFGEFPGLELLHVISEYGIVSIEKKDIEKIDLTTISANDFRKAYTTIERIMKLPINERKMIGNNSLWIRLGTVLHKYDFRDISHEEGCYRMAILQDLNSAVAWFNLGMIINNNEEKRNCFRHVTEIEPRNAPAWCELGECLLDENEKIRCYRKAIQINPNFSHGWDLLVDLSDGELLDFNEWNKPHLKFENSIQQAENACISLIKENIHNFLIIWNIKCSIYHHKTNGGYSMQAEMILLAPQENENYFNCEEIHDEVFNFPGKAYFNDIMGCIKQLNSIIAYFFLEAKDYFEDIKHVMEIWHENHYGR